ncbi:c-type cytochrome [Halomonas campaniensis]|uniref:c-type cytochrome n=1 Tax=Halomonas campaniensis TaxID=213554 RepID=UPI00397105A9
MSAHRSFRVLATALAGLSLALLAPQAFSGPGDAHGHAAASHDHAHPAPGQADEHPHAAASHEHDQPAPGHADEPPHAAASHPDGHAPSQAPPPAGTATHDHNGAGHGDAPAHAHNGQKRSIPDEWLERESPLWPSDDNLAFGQEVYQRFCAACHGERGRGNGVAAGVAGFVPAPTDLTVHGAGHAAGEYAWLVSAGNPQSAMPQFAGRLGEEEIWAVVLYVRHALAAGESGNHAH